MTRATVAVTFISVQAAKPSYAYKNPPYPPVQNGLSRVLVRAALPALPAGAVITSAKLWVNQTGAWTGSNTLFAQRNFATWTNLATWNTKPALGDTAHSKTLSGTAADQWWDIDVTADVQGFYAKTKNNWGWSLYTSSSTRRNLNGSTSPGEKPYLAIDYVLPAKTPTNLSPTGAAVSVAKPVLTFTVGDDVTGVQVQIDPAANGTTPGFDSGTVSATGGVLDLAGTAYAGLSNGSTTYWRARAQTSSGWSAWSAWVSFSRQDLSSLALTAPAATVADVTPPFAWTFGGTQTAFQADLIYMGPDLKKAGTVVSSSGRVAGTASSWTPPGVPIVGPVSGLQYRARVRVWDNVTRAATQGVVAYAEAATDFTVDFDGTVDPMDTVVATQVLSSPGVTLTGTRAAGIPDEVGILHDGELVARLDGADVFTSSTAYSLVDWYARMGRPVEISVVAIVNGEFADDSPSTTVTPECDGVWLVDPDTNTAAVLWGNDEGQWAASDIATLHTTTDGNVTRRRLARARLSGSISGRALTARGYDADEVVEAFEQFADNDASQVYRYIAGHLNVPAIAGNFVITPTPVEKSKTVARVQFDWWEKA